MKMLKREVEHTIPRLKFKQTRLYLQIKSTQFNSYIITRAYLGIFLNREFAHTHTYERVRLSGRGRPSTAAAPAHTSSAAR